MAVASAAARHPGIQAAVHLRFLLVLAAFWLGCLLHSLAVLPLFLLPRRPRQRLARASMSRGFRAYLALMRAAGQARFDLAELDRLVARGPLVLAANHRSLLDAVLIVSRLPTVVCIAKAPLWRNPCLWGSLHAAGYLRDDTPLRTVRAAEAALAGGAQLLVFPEGTRGRGPLAPFRPGAALLGRLAGVPVQTVLIDSDTDFLGPGWPLLRRPDTPMRFRLRLGPRIAPGTDLLADTDTLRRHIETGLAATPLRSGP